MPILEILALNAVPVITKFLIDQISKYKTKKGTNSEIEVLNKKLGTYLERAELVEKELEDYKKITQELESKLGSNYISDDSFVNWNLDTIKPGTQAFNVNVWTEKGDFQKARDITVIPKTNAYRLGDKINIYFQSDRDCYLTLINYGTSGKLTVLLPNALHRDNFIEGGNVYALPGTDYPFDYILSGPSGVERIKAIATTRKVDLMELNFDSGNVFATSTAAARDISVVAKNVDSKQPGDWAEGMCEFEVR